MKTPISLLTLCPALAGLLSGCVAAVVPIAMGGLVAKGRAEDSRKHADPRGRAIQGVAAPSRPALPDAPPAPDAVKVFQGTLPPPDGVSRPDLIVTGTQGSTPQPVTPGSGSTWSDLGHYVASHLENRGHSALLMRGSETASPSWAPCGGKPLAVLATVTAVLQHKASATNWTNSLQTLDIRVILTSPRAEADRDLVSRAVRNAGWLSALDRDTLLLGQTAAQLPSTRALLTSRYCVVAVAGAQGSDFPNGLTPETSPPGLAGMWGAGWFMMPSAKNADDAG